jgi:hypothetical protein
MDCWVTTPLTRRWTAKLEASASVVSRRVDKSKATLIGRPDGHRIKDKVMESNPNIGRRPSCLELRMQWKVIG